METLGAQPCASPSSLGITGGIPSTNYGPFAGKGAIASLKGATASQPLRREIAMCYLTCNVMSQPSRAVNSNSIKGCIQPTGMLVYEIPPSAKSAVYGSMATLTDQQLVNYGSGPEHFTVQLYQR